MKQIKEKEKIINGKKYIGSISWYDKEWVAYTATLIFAVIFVTLFKVHIL